MMIKFFDRFEIKYLIDREQYQRMTGVLAEYMQPDRQGDRPDRYRVTSLYYDTVDYRAYWDKIEGHRFRRKVRIRIYGEQPVTEETACFTEIKQRINKTLQKKRAVMSYHSALALCGAGAEIPEELSDRDQAVANEIRYLQHTLQLQPACLVSYDRLAFNGNEYDPGLRVTFDTDLKGRSRNLSLLTAAAGESQYVIAPQWCIMEVKANRRVPFWLTKLVNQQGCTLRRISKYCAALEQSKILLKTQRITQ
jgi:hypothetical protein